MPQITLDSVVRIHEDAVFRELGGEAAVVLAGADASILA